MSGQRWPRAAAVAAAREVCAALRPVTTRLMVVGSLRRRCAEVGDVDVLYVPRFEDRQLDMFTTGPMDMSEEVVGGLVLSGVLSKRPRMIGGQPSESFTWGAQNKLAVHRGGVPVDLLKSKDEDWWNAVVFRTGSEQSNIRIAEAAQARGWKWNISGSGFARGGALAGPAESHAVESEREVFDFVGLPYLEPEERK